MKQTLAIMLLAATCLGARAQLKTTTSCPTLNVNILDGKINDVPPSYTVAQIKERIPCYTGMEDESANAKCGGGVYYKDKDVYFYTARDYVEIGPKFKGKLSIPLMGASRSGLFKWLGHPKIKDTNWDAFSTQYGILILYYDKARKVNRIRFSTQSEQTIKLCE